MKVLFIDDEKEILTSITRQLRKTKFIVSTSISGKDALERLKQETYPIIVSDERMPDISGLELMKKIKKLYPESIRIILSGYADSQTIIDAINQGEIFRFIAKPWSYDSLIENLTQSENRWNINQSNKHFMEKILEENIRLKRRLSYRESKLDLNSEILDEVPSPLIVIGKDNRVEVFNSKLGQLLDNNLACGQLITDLIDDKTYSLIEMDMKHSSNSDKRIVEIKGKKYTIFARGLRPTDDYKGILVLEEIK